MRTLRLLLIIALAVPAAVAAAAAADQKAGANRLTPKEVAESVQSAIDTSVDPCQDFYQHACGNWMKTTTMPADRPQWGRSFSEIDERNLGVLKTILEDLSAKPGGGEQAKLGVFYRSCMDEAGVEKAGASPLTPLLGEIAKVKGPATFMEMVGKLHRVNVDAGFQLIIWPDFKDPNVQIAHIFQGGLGLPDRDYYLKDDDQSKELRKGYEAHVTKMLSLLGEPEADAARHAAQIVAFETELAKESRPSDEMRNLEKLYHKIDITGLKALTPDLPWERYLAGIGYPGLVPVNAGTPEFLKGLASIAKTTQPDVLQAYLRWQLVSGTAPLLSKAFVDENFAFFGAKLSGQQEIETRWKRCVTATDAAMGELLGQAFIDREFPGDSKAIAVEMIHSIEAAFEAGLPSLTWMDDATRKRALDKMKAITNKIGYPDTWRDYSGLAVTPASYFDNSTAARVFEFKHEGDKIGKPRDRKEWGMTPPTVNAYYNPTANEIVFPAGVLQRPFFHRDFPIPMNFGGIGMVMGHELTHGFDDQGRKFDPSGQMSEWWDPEVVKKFEERAQCVDDLYDTYEVLPGVHLNGKLTLGENIADLGGVKEAYNAYKMWVKKHGEPAPTIEGVTNDQLFFLGFAQSWCVLETPEYAKMMANVNPHSAARFRVIGPLSNLPAFSEAFGCKEGSPMRPAKTCEVW